MAAPSPSRRQVALLVVVIGGALLVERGVALTSPEPEVVGPRLAATSARANRQRAEGRTAASAPPAALRLDRLDARAQALSEADDSTPPRAQQPALFDPVTWDPVPMPTAPAVPVVATRPTAPPFPYAYMGGLEDDGVRTAFFTQGDRVLTVKPHDTVDSVYRVDQMTESQMTLTYLPLDQTLVVSLGGRR